MLLAGDSGSTPPVKRCTMRLHGRIGSREVLILVDSGANCSFVDAALVEELALLTQDIDATTHVVAGGAKKVAQLS